MRGKAKGRVEVGGGRAIVWRCTGCHARIFSRRGCWGRRRQAGPGASSCFVGEDETGGDGSSSDSGQKLSIKAKTLRRALG